MIFYIPWTDELVIILWHHGPLGVSPHSVLIGENSMEVGSMSVLTALDWGWKYVGII